MDSQDGIEEIGQADTVRLGDQAEVVTVAVEAPGPTLFDNLETGFVVAKEQSVFNFACGCLVGQLKGRRTEPLHVDNSDQAIGQDAPQGGIGLDVFEFGHGARHSPVQVCNAAGSVIRKAATPTAMGSLDDDRRVAFLTVHQTLHLLRHVDEQPPLRRRHLAHDIDDLQHRRP